MRFLLFASLCTIWCEGNDSHKLLSTPALPKIYLQILQGAANYISSTSSWLQE